jgi:hypothetical protein
MKVGDLISYKFKNQSNSEWSDISIIIGQHRTPLSKNHDIYEIYCEGETFHIDISQMHILLLTDTLQQSG